jgi:hypothetical protein
MKKGRSVAAKPASTQQQLKVVLARQQEMLAIIASIRARVASVEQSLEAIARALARRARSEVES